MIGGAEASARDVFGEAVPGHPNHVLFRLGPDVEISLGARAKVPGDETPGEDVELVAHHQPGERMEPYERLLTDAMPGDAFRFSRQDFVEARGGRRPDPREATPVHLYEPGTWGAGGRRDPDRG